MSFLIRNKVNLLKLSSSGLGISFFIYLKRASFSSLSISAARIENIWLLPSQIDFLLLAIICVSSFIGGALLILKISQRAGLSYFSFENISNALFPFSLSCLLIFQLNPLFNSFSSFNIVIFKDLSDLIILFIFVAVILRFKSLFYSSVNNLNFKKKFEGKFNWRNFKFRWSLISVIFILSLVIYLSVLPHLPGLNGDEPHYLLIIQSIIQDLDLDINNNYVDRDYNDYIPGVLDRHVSIGRKGVRYSTHPVGLAFFLALPYLIGGYHGVVLFLNLCAALLAVQFFLLFFEVTNNLQKSILLWFLISFTVPVLPYSAKVFPELPAALLFIYSYRKVKAASKLRLYEIFLAGVSLAILPWFQQRFILLTIVLSLYFISLHYKSVLKCLSFIAPIIFSFVSLSLFYFILYGNPLPSAPYTSVHIGRIWSFTIFLYNGVWGLLFDQEFGILIYSPIYLFMGAGLWIKYKQDRKGSFFWLLMFFSVYIPAAGFTLKWYGSWAPMGRYLIVLIPLIAEVVAYAFSFQLSVFLGWTIALMGYAGLFFSWFLVHHYDLWIGAENGHSKLLGSLSNTTDLTEFFPSFISPNNYDYFVLGVWIIVIIVFSFVVIRTENTFSNNKKKMKNITKNEKEKREINENLFKNKSVFHKQVDGFFSWFFIMLFSWLIVTMLIQMLATVLNEPQFSKKFQRKNNSLAKVPLVISSKILDNRIKEKKIDFIIKTNRKSLADGKSPGYIISGPYVTLPEGVYQAIFTIKLLKTTPSDPFAALDVSTFRGHKVLAAKTIYQTEFKQEEKIKRFYLLFQLNKITPNIETRVFSMHVTNFELIQIRLGTTENLIHLWKGRKYRDLGLLRSALSELKSVSVDQDALTVVWKDIGLLYEEMNHPKDGIPFLKRYYKKNKNDIQTSQHLGRLLIRCGFKEEGIAFLQSLQK